MALLSQLPNPQDFSDILAPVIGDEAAGTGVAAVAKLLENIDTGSLSADFAVRLDGALSFDADIDASSLTSGVSNELGQVLATLPADPGDVVAIVGEALATIKALSSGTLAEKLNAGLEGAQAIKAVIPGDIRQLIDSAAQPMTALKSEFIGGEFAQLRQWSDSISQLKAEMQPIVAGGSEGLEERLITFLGEKVGGISDALFPQGNIALRFAGQLDGILSAQWLQQADALKLELIDALKRATVDFDSGNFSNATNLNLATLKFEQLIALLASLTAKLNGFLDSGLASQDRVMAAAAGQLDNFAQIEIIDVGNIKDKFAGAIERAETQIRELDLEGVSGQVEDLFARIDSTVKQYSLNKLVEEIDAVETQLIAVIERVDAAWLETVATVRSTLSGVGDKLQSVLGQLGSFDGDGIFRFHVQADIEDFLNGIRTTLTDNIQPMLDEFQRSIGAVLDEVQASLAAVQEQIDSVKAELEGALAVVHAMLQEADVSARVEDISNRFEQMLGELGSIDFDPIVDPVVAQIDEMKESIKKIDLSSMSEVSIGALKVSTKVVIDIDFSAKITGALMAEFDKLLELPKQALKEIEEQVESALAKFAELNLGVLLAPLDDVFLPVQEKLNALDLAVLLEPLNEWHAQAKAKIDTVSPAALLQPLNQVHAELKSGVEELSPAALVEPLQASIDEAKAEIAKLDVAGLASGLQAPIDDLKQRLGKLSPEGLLDPLIDAFDKIMGALDQFDPTLILKPFDELFAAITGPLANLNPTHVALIADIFAALQDALDTLDPERLGQRLVRQLEPLDRLVGQVDVGGMMVALQGPHLKLKASFEANAGPVQLSAQVNALNPLQSDAMTQLSAEIRRFQKTVAEFSSKPVPGELTKSYQSMRERIEALIPDWISEDMTPVSVRAAFMAANPLHLQGEIRSLYEAMKDQVRVFDPRSLQERLRTSFESATEALLGIDASTINDKVEVLIDTVVQRLDQIDLNLMVEEVQGATLNLNGMVDSVNPQPIIDELQGLTDEVTAIVDALKPEEALAGLNEPFEQSKQIVEAFDPASFKQPLIGITEDIQNIVLQIDLGVVLEPLVKKLEELREALEAGLRRTEDAFNGMVKALPA